MKLFKSVIVLFLMASIVTSCKSEAKKEETKENKETTVAKAEMLSLNVSGMSCEIGCAKTIESKLAKKEGVLEAKVVFADSLATIKYDAEKIDKASLIAFVEGVGDGHTYKASESGKMACASDCKMACCTKADKKACAEDCKKECCTAKEAKNCSDSKEDCCKDTANKLACVEDCKKENCAAKKA
ncbi:cation transporter [Tenacibaculum sp. MEBiC06402]|uniref:cation transporter n=1 Tax=unclassified Tenacibaculum TaxID=2635139 RepID=UPI003B9ABAC3